MFDQLNSKTIAPYQSTKEMKLNVKFYLIVTIHALAAAGLFLYTPTWKTIFLTLLAAYAIGGGGIEMTFHRCLTHRAFNFKYKWLERSFATLGTLGLQQGPIWWSSIHRIHHRHADTSQDPHDNQKGIFYSHMLWLFHLDPRWELPARYDQYRNVVPDIAADPYYRWLDRNCYLPSLIYFIGLYLIGGGPALFFTGFLATVCAWHSIWAINSLAHRFGYRSYSTQQSDRSTNHWPTGLFYAGGGWHNNHHAFPSAAKHGFHKWWEIDLTYLTILFLRILGLVHHVKCVSLKQRQKTKLTYAYDS